MPIFMIFCLIKFINSNRKRKRKHLDVLKEVTRLFDNIFSGRKLNSVYVAIIGVFAGMLIIELVTVVLPMLIDKEYSTISSLSSI